MRADPPGNASVRSVRNRQVCLYRLRLRRLFLGLFLALIGAAGGGDHDLQQRVAIGFGRQTLVERLELGRPLLDGDGS